MGGACNVVVYDDQDSEFLSVVDSFFPKATFKIFILIEELLLLFIYLFIYLFIFV